MLAYLSNVCNCVNNNERKDYICNVKFTSPEGGGGGRWKTEAPQPWQKSVSLGQTF